MMLGLSSRRPSRDYIFAPLWTSSTAELDPQPKPKPEREVVRFIRRRRKPSVPRPVRDTIALAVGCTSAAVLRHISLLAGRSSSRDQEICVWSDVLPDRVGDGGCIEVLVRQAYAKLLRQFDKQKTIQYMLRNFEAAVRNIHLPHFLADPPLLFLIAAPITFAFAISALRNSHGRERYQDHILGGGIVVGIAAASLSRNFRAEVLMVLPWAVIVALVFSAVTHRILGLRPNDTKSDEDGIDILMEKNTKAAAQ